MRFRFFNSACWAVCTSVIIWFQTMAFCTPPGPRMQAIRKIVAYPKETPRFFPWNIRLMVALVAGHSKQVELRWIDDEQHPVQPFGIFLVSVCNNDNEAAKKNLQVEPMVPTRSIYDYIVKYAKMTGQQIVEFDEGLVLLPRDGGNDVPVKMPSNLPVSVKDLLQYGPGEFVSFEGINVTSTSAILAYINQKIEATQTRMKDVPVVKIKIEEAQEDIRYQNRIAGFQGYFRYEQFIQAFCLAFGYECAWNDGTLLLKAAREKQHNIAPSR